jgi:hypothetical protein
MLFLLMLAGLMLSASIPRAFEDRGLVFALALASMQVGRNLFMLWALRRHDAGNFRNFIRIAVWRGMSAALYILGGLLSGHLRMIAWTVALAVDCLAPVLYFRIPWIGSSSTADWNVEGTHMAERCGLFIILALGESILITGATFAELTWTVTALAAFTVAFVGSIAMWMIYFNIGAERASRQISSSQDPGRMARSGYTYLHIRSWLASRRGGRRRTHSASSRRPYRRGHRRGHPCGPRPLSRRSGLVQTPFRAVFPAVAPCRAWTARPADSGRDVCHAVGTFGGRDRHADPGRNVGMDIAAPKHDSSGVLNRVHYACMLGIIANNRRRMRCRLGAAKAQGNGADETKLRTSIDKSRGPNRRETPCA